jgi:hypothetical protein
MLVPLQVIDGFLLNVNLGDALLVGFVLGLGAVAIKQSRQLLTLHVMLFGALLLMAPGNMYEPADFSLLGSILQYKLVGLVLLVVSPVLYATADS